MLSNLNELSHNSYAFWTKIVRRSMRRLVAVLSNLAVVIFPSGYEKDELGDIAEGRLYTQERKSSAGNSIGL